MKSNNGQSVFITLGICLGGQNREFLQNSMGGDCAHDQKVIGQQES